MSARTRTSTRTTKPKASPSNIDLAALVALLTPAQKEALGIEEAPKEPGTPFLSCWTASRVNANAKGVFTHSSKKSGTSKSYRKLSEAEAIAAVKANIAAGRVYAIPHA